jgi:hypothetical protein
LYALVSGVRGCVAVLSLAGTLAGGCGHRHAAWQIAAELAKREAERGDEVRVDDVSIDASGIVEAELCVDLYAHGDRPGHPSIACARSITYLAVPTPHGWITRKLEPMVVECFLDWPPQPDLPGQAEVGLPIPRPRRNR